MTSVSMLATKDVPMPGEKLTKIHIFILTDLMGNQVTMVASNVTDIIQLPAGLIGPSAPLSWRGKVWQLRDWAMLNQVTVLHGTKIVGFELKPLDILPKTEEEDFLFSH